MRNSVYIRWKTFERASRDRIPAFHPPRRTVYLAREILEHGVNGNYIPPEFDSIPMSDAGILCALVKSRFHRLENGDGDDDGGGGGDDSGGSRENFKARGNDTFDSLLGATRATTHRRNMLREQFQARYRTGG